MIFPPDHCRNRRADLNPFGVCRSRKDAWIWLPLRRSLPGTVLITVQVIDVDLIELLQIALAHSCMRQPIQPGIIRDEGDDALASFLHNTPFRHAEESHIEIIQPLPLRTWRTN